MIVGTTASWASRKHPITDGRGNLRILLLGCESNLKVEIARATRKMEDGLSVEILSTRASLSSLVPADLFVVRIGASVSNEHLRQIKDRFPVVPMVVVVSSSDERLVLTSLLAGACGCVTEPVTRRELRAAVLKALNGRLALNPNAEKALLITIHEAGIRAFGLTGRQVEVLSLLRKRASDKDIAEKLSISSGTVHVHIARLFKKLGVHNRKQAVAKYPYICI